MDNFGRKRTPLKIIIVDDSEVFREGLKFFIEYLLEYQVIYEARSGMEFLELKYKNEADIILMDIHMPVLNGIETFSRDLDNNLRKTIAISNLDEDIYLDKLIEVGFKGYLNKNSIYKELKGAIDVVFEGGLYFPEKIKMGK
ncbi:MAG TPA: response regulator transcription factor [Bacteroidales bacterium]|nr:response regulator transcription factor [Bacteroidales bacterium]